MGKILEYQVIFFPLSLQVRSLEQQNKLLEAEIKAYQDRFQKPSGLRLLYEEQLKELRKIAEKMRVQRVRQNPPSHTSPVSFFFSFFFKDLRCSSEHQA